MSVIPHAPVKRTKLLGSNLIQEDQFKSSVEASKATDTPLKTIENNLKSGRPNRKGYVWKYV